MNMFTSTAGLKRLMDSEFENLSQPILVGFLQKGSEKNKFLPGVHRPGKKHPF